MQSQEVATMPRYMSLSKEKLGGVTYTPPWIVNLILDKLEYSSNILDKKIIDPACGDGNFLVAVVDRFLAECKRNKVPLHEAKRLLENNIYGFDIDKNSLVKCKTNLNTIASSYGIENIEWHHLTCIDSLDKSKAAQYFNIFDFVIGNPPYIRIQNLNKENREIIQRDWAFCESGSTDIYIAFFELGIKLLSKSGKLGYITPKTFLKTETAAHLRLYLKDHKLIKEIIDFNHYQVFNEVTTYSAITILNNDWNRRFFYYYEWSNETPKFISKIDIGTLSNNFWILGSQSTLDRIKKIETRGVQLDKIAKIHVGITTLADDFYIFRDPNFNGAEAEIKLKDGRTFSIEKSILKPIIKVSVLKSENEQQNRFIIFPYKKAGKKHIIIPKSELKSLYPLTYQYFLTIKPRLLLRDKGKKNAVAWYAFGRSQGLDTSFGKKILVVPMSLKPKFIVWEHENYTFYAGYCIKFDGDLRGLAKQLNSEDMDFYIRHVAREYRNGYRSYAKSFIKNFGITLLESMQNIKKQQILH